MSQQPGVQQFPLEPPESSASQQAGASDAPGGPQVPQHKRVYQACIPCRRRKVKCDLGSVDNPSDPPCVRCRRESKECFFSATRRKRKADSEARDESLDGYEQADDYMVRNGRKRLHSESGAVPEALAALRSQSVMSASPVAPRPPSSYVDGTGLGAQPLTPGGHLGRSEPLRRPHQSPNGSYRDERPKKDDRNAQFENPEAQEVMRPSVYGPHDALDLLYKAATNSPGHKRFRSESTSNMQQSPRNSDKFAGPSSHAHPMPATAQQNSQYQNEPMAAPGARREEAIDPALTQPHDRTQEPGYKDAIKVWSRFRFVRAGWLTPPEAIDYIDYYYEYLSPLTPISPPTFRNPGTHRTLLTEEPILTVTLLTVASRYMKVPGTGGHCRSHAIHEQLWTYLRGMIERCLWGQEAFGGGFCGSHADTEAQTSSTAPWRGLRKGSLRTLGTIESLMILTEWHPRALHFPPQEATDELMLPSYDAPDSFSTDEEGNHRQPGGVGGKRIESWLEPAWRSDRMCWMLLSNAWGLAYELGVFDQIDDLLAGGSDMTRPEYEEEGYRLRAARIKKLLLIYISQLAGRLGWTNMVPENLRGLAFTENRRRRQSTDGSGTTPGTNTTINAFNYIPDLELDDQIIHCWAGISNAMHIGNERVFRSRKHTTEIIQSGRYIELLKEFQPMLSNWQRNFEGYRLPPYIKHILTIEYEYVRIYVNSLSLQAVVERCTNNAAANAHGGGVSQNGSVTGVPHPLSPETQNLYGKLPLAKLGGFGAADQEYVKEVVDGSRNLLRTVVDGLLPNDYLKHAPVRTYFRIISGAMFLLKTFALGASKSDVEVSIGLMDRVVDALRNCVVDDVHLGIRFADLLETLTSRLRNRFMQAPSTDSPVRRGARSPVGVMKGAAGGNGQQGGGQGAGNGEGSKRLTRVGWDDSVPEPAAGFSHDQSNPPQDMHASNNPSISATPFDISAPGSLYSHSPFNAPSNNFPGSGVDGNGGNGGGDWGNWGDTGDMWYLPAGPAFFQNGDQLITQTAEGVNVGGMDLLEYMAMDNFGGVEEGVGGF